MNVHHSFDDAIMGVQNRFLFDHHRIHTDQWQSVDVSKNPQAEMAELLDVIFQVCPYSNGLDAWRREIQPNLPWADDHFLERVGGIPLNPGAQWKHWPWSNSADKFRTEGEQFSHTYMERYWPKYVNHPIGDPATDCMMGIRYRYGDLHDVIEHLLKHPLSRQAYLPVWFPEDTGVVHGERVPCTLGYHFILRSDRLHITYYIRSCDLYRHFRDDLYLTARLQLWVLEQLQKRSGQWRAVKIGNFTFHCTSLHCFRSDYQKLFKEDI